MLLSKTQNSKKFNASRLSKAIQIAGVCALTALPGIASSDNVSVDATVNVNNTFTLTKNSDLHFGSIAAFADTSGGGDESALVMTADGTLTATSSTNSSIMKLDESLATPAEIEVGGAAGNSDLTVTFTMDDGAGNYIPFTSINMTPPATPTGGTPRYFILDNLTTQATTGSGTAPTMTTDLTGTLVFSIGGRIRTDSTDLSGAINTAYNDGDYTGTFVVNVNY